MDRDRSPAAGVGVLIDMMAAGDAGKAPASGRQDWHIRFPETGFT